MNTFAEKLTTIAENEPKVYEAGKKAERSVFWDAYQENGNRVDYARAFNSKWWTDQNFDPKYDMIPTDASEMFRNSKITDYKSKVNIDFSKSTTFSSCFNNSPIVEIGVIDMSSSNNLKYAIYNCTNLTKIEKVIITANQNVEESSFKGNPKLETVIFEGVIATSGLNVQSSAKLSHESLMSIINCLEDKSADTSGTEWLIKIGGDNIAKLTDEECNIAEMKGWNLE